MGFDGYLTFWFEKKDLGIAFAIMHTIGRCGTAVHFVIMPPLYDVKGSLALPMLVAFLLYGGQTLSCLIVIYMTYVEGKRRDEESGTTGETSDSIWDLMFNCKFYSPAFWMLAVLCGLFYGGLFIFLSFSSGVLQKRFLFDNEETGFINVNYYI